MDTHSEAVLFGWGSTAVETGMVFAGVELPWCTLIEGVSGIPCGGDGLAGGT